MFTLVAPATRSFVAQRGARTVATISRDATKAATATNAAAPPAQSSAGISTTAAPAKPASHIVENGRVTSANRLFHSTSSWEVRDVPSNKPSANFASRQAAEQKRRIARNRNAMDLL